MKDEIKEILEDVKRHLDYVEATKQSSIRDNEMKVMYDCIINLQHELERLKKENRKLYKKDTKIINELKEELEITQEKWNKDKQWSECRTKEWLNYKSRCERLLEKINFYKTTEWGLRGYGILDLFENILNDGDEE